MRYLLMVFNNESIWQEGEREACMVESRELCHQLAEEGKFIDASPLHPVATATSVRVRDGKTLITDGPFAETHEQLGGYYLVDVASLDEAIDIAARIPPASRGTVEIRPIHELTDMPGDKPL